MPLTIDGMNICADITRRVVEEAVMRRRQTLDNPGLCIACGQEQDGCEPDARNYECESCGEPRVFGCEELLLEML